MAQISQKNIKDLAISTGKIQDNAVDGDKIADNVALAGAPTTSTASSGDNSTKIATTAFVSTAISNNAEGLKPKAAVRLASTANVVIASALEAGDSIDGVVLAEGDRVLLKDQTSALENGIYVAVAAAAGAASRSTDFDSLSPIDEINGAYVPVQEGTANAGKYFVQTGVVATLETDDIDFVFFNSATSIIAGDGLDKTGDTLSLDLKASGGLKIDATEVAVEPADFAGTGLEDDGSDNLRLATQGNGIAGGAGSTLSVKPDITETSTVQASAIIVQATGVAISVDDSTIEGSLQGSAGAESLRVKDAGITTAKLAGTSVTAAKLGSDVAGDGLKGGNGAAIDVEPADFAGAGLEDDGADNLRINVDATNGTTKVNGSNELEGLKQKQDLITLDGTDITNQYVDLTQTASHAGSISVIPVDGIEQEQGTDYTVSLAGGAGGVTRITFAGDIATGGDAALIATDKLIVKFEYL